MSATVPKGLQGHGCQARFIAMRLDWGESIHIAKERRTLELGYVRGETL